MTEPVDVSTLFPRLRQELDHCALLLDVDGTILDLAPTPREVFVPSELRHDLARLRELTKGAIAFVSGRGINELDLIFAPLALAAVGGHGAEIRISPDSEIKVQKVQPLPAKIKQRFAAIAEAGPGIIVEDKVYSIALHYRLAPEHEGYVRRSAVSICEELDGQALEILPGKSVVEIKQTGFNKATGVQKLMSSAPFRGRKPIFIGDDVTDELVFPIIPQFNGFAFCVGRHVSEITGYFDSPKEVRRWLQILAMGTTP